jgi:superfamily II DNA/RNA helicase
VQSPSTFKVPKNLVFDSVTIDDEEKELEMLVQFIKDNLPALKDANSSVMMVFCDKKSRVDKVCEALKAIGIASLPFEESMSSQARNLSLSILRSGSLQVLVSDKAGSRGLDLPNVNHVVQFDFAKTTQDFL